jgi:hypothetical protein
VDDDDGDVNRGLDPTVNHDANVDCRSACLDQRILQAMTFDGPFERDAT